MLKNNWIMIAALTLSGLVHAIALSYYLNDKNGSMVDSVASVSVQLELVKPSIEKVIPDEKAAEVPEEVVTVNQPVETREINHADANKTHTETTESYSAIESEIVADFTDPQASTEDQVVGERADDLKKHVYAAINKQKHYPFIARKQRREGTVKLNFVMHPDGQVTDVAITQSSDFTVLDRAARKAVEAISPFHMAAEYLEARHQYNVDIAFRLN